MESLRGQTEEADFKEKIITRMQEHSEHEASQMRKLNEENYNRLDKFLRDQAEQNKQTQKENLEYMKTATKESLSRIENNYENIRETDMKIIERLLREMKDSSKSKFPD